MLVPSIDIRNGETVQLVQGREHALSAGDARKHLQVFAPTGEVAVIDLDAALGTGSNASLIRELIAKGRCRVGGGIRDVETAISWLDAGASKVILGTRAVPDVLKELPRERVIAALDAFDDEVVVEGWTKGTGKSVLEGLKELREYVGGFLVTFVEREGKLGGTRMDKVREIVNAASPARVTIAGGITTTEEIRELDALGADAQVGMALYTGRMNLAEAFLAPVTSDRSDGLIPTVVTDERGIALGLAYSNAESISLALQEQRGIYYSRKRGVWRKGEESGATQELLRIDLDCDRDTLRFVVRQHGSGFCHVGTQTCFGEPWGIGALEKRIQSRQVAAVPNSYVSKLLRDRNFLNAKLREEADELSAAVTPSEVVGECADLLFFAQVALARSNASLSDVEKELDSRSLRITRRSGEAKPGYS